MKDVSVQAVCFKCGQSKKDPIKMCGNCKTWPESKQDLIVSMCLSAKCIKPENLLRSSKYIRLKRRPPGFHDKVLIKATKLVEALPPQLEAFQSIELSASFFETDVDLLVD